MAELERAILHFWLLPVAFFNECVKAAWQAERSRQRSAIGLD